MRLIAVCDSDGAIFTLMTMPLDGLRPSLLNLPPTQREVEFNAAQISDELDNQEIHADYAISVSAFVSTLRRPALSPGAVDR